MPLLETKGAASAQGFGLSLGEAEKVYIEDVFSTYLYTGNGSTQTITNGIDLAGDGGLVWAKIRSGFNSPLSHALFDTSRGVLNRLASNLTDAQASTANSLTAFNSTGFTVGSSVTVNGGGAGDSYVSWTFRKQPKFFDVVTYTGNGTQNRAIAHSLGSTPGCIIIKRTDTTSDWWVAHRGVSTAAWASGLRLNSTDAHSTSGNIIFNLGDSAVFNLFLGPAADQANINGGTYVAYLFAHDAGGFGLTGTDNVISCGSFTTNSSGNATINLGYEPQFVLFKGASGSNATGDPWGIGDVMRGLTQTNIARLVPNLSNAEDNITSYVPTPTATGFDAKGFAGSTTYIYIAIRRGPMKVPTSGTSVYYAEAVPQGDSQQTTGVPFPSDLVHSFSRDGTSRDTTYQYINFNLFMDRLRGMGVPSNSFAYSNSGIELVTSETIAETKDGYIQSKADGMNITRGTGFNSTAFGKFIYHFFRRAPSFFDVVCYTGTGGGANAYQDVAHNLGVTPELIIVKQRDAVNATAPYDWPVYQKDITSNGVGVAWMVGNAAKTTDYLWRRGASGQKIDASTFSLNGNYLMSNQSGGTYVAYLFATCPGVSKVGSYTGTGTTQQINCGFTGGARFVLIKRTDSTGDWYVWDTARGIVSGNDPYLLLNSTAAEVTSTDYIDPVSIGFEISSSAPAAINANGGTFIYLAIA